MPRPSTYFIQVALCTPTRVSSSSPAVHAAPPALKTNSAPEHSVCRLILSPLSPPSLPLQDVLSVGERVTGLLSLISKDSPPKLQISTLELEKEAGDMLAGPEARARCFEAVEQFLAFR